MTTDSFWTMECRLWCMTTTEYLSNQVRSLNLCFDSKRKQFNIHFLSEDIFIASSCSNVSSNDMPSSSKCNFLTGSSSPDPTDFTSLSQVCLGKRRLHIFNVNFTKYFSIQQALIRDSINSLF